MDHLMGIFSGESISVGNAAHVEEEDDGSDDDENAYDRQKEYYDTLSERWWSLESEGFWVKATTMTLLDSASESATTMSCA